MKKLNFRNGIKKINKLSLTTCSLVASLGLFTLTDLKADTFTLVQGGYTEGASLTVSFTGNDLDNNGQLVSFEGGEITDFTMTFSGNSLVDAFSMRFDNLWGFVFTLDETALGDDDSGASEGIGSENDLFQYITGPGPLAICNGTNICGQIMDSDGNVLDSTLIALGESSYILNGNEIAPSAIDLYDKTVTGGGESPAKQSAKALSTIKDNIASYPEMENVIASLMTLGSDKAIANAIETTTPQTTTSSTAASSQISNGLAGIVEQRQNVNINSGFNTGDVAFSQKNIWAKPFGTFGKQDSKDGINGFDLNSYGLGIGVDGEYKTNQNFGLALFYTNASVDVNNVNQTSNLDIITVLGYGNIPIFDSKTNLLYQLGYAWQKTKSNRALFTGHTARADYTSKTASLDLKLLRDYQLSKTLLVQPMVTATYRHFTTPSYKESGAGASNLNVQKATSSELLLGLGSIVHYELNSDSKIISNINLEYDLQNKEQSVTSSFEGASGVSYTTNGIDNGRWGYDIGFGYESYITENTNINISYNYQAQGSSFTNNVISAKLVYEF